MTAPISVMFLEPSFRRELTLFDDDSTREKATVLDKWEVMIDDSRNPVFDGLDTFLQFGKTYRISFQEVIPDEGGKGRE